MLTDYINAADGGASWTWSTGENNTWYNCRSAWPNYYVSVRKNGCSSTDTVVVRNDCYMNIPNVFTPKMMG